MGRTSNRFVSKMHFISSIAMTFTRVERMSKGIWTSWMKELAISTRSILRFIFSLLLYPHTRELYQKMDIRHWKTLLVFSQTESLGWLHVLCCSLPKYVYHLSVLLFFCRLTRMRQGVKLRSRMCVHSVGKKTADNLYVRRSWERKEIREWKQWK